MTRTLAIVFDLDGTLIDSQASILTSIRLALDESGINSVVPLSKDLIGPPLLETLAAICGTSNTVELSRVAAKFKDAYDTAGFQHSVRYEGIDDLLAWLHADGYRVCLVTNKRLIPTEKILDHFDWRRYFSYVYTIDSAGEPFKNKTEAIGTLLKESGIDPAHAVYVGDRHEDYEAATNNHMKCLLVQWGYGFENQAIQSGKAIETTADLKAVIQSLQ